MNGARTSTHVKRALVDAGFEVFRSRGDEIALAERPRENLIMDSGVRLRIGDPFEVRVILRAQKADFPNEDETQLFERVRRLAGAALPPGFHEVNACVTRVTDPGDAERVLDTFYEVTFAKSASALADALGELKVALAIEKRA
ncbi:MAG: hypothetical protein FWD17_03340 [Polyangiaceae bacterium]|nr:hypothetical protein [Polyangiaceae bacterium]